ncbi:PREDICTED: uncharacterized protein LOC107066013 [Polistes dominula]|uniref:Amine oxidase n=1 Tax=Polistes dominula TaxID=743375 RepID=A0ABM1I657_POLDO|nr:PREDICTED: uncharacterized protein LOC107066013 [Polistes dominula]
MTSSGSSSTLHSVGSLSKDSESQNGADRLREESRIVIIGAGLAGISAASRLLKLGFKNVIIIEADTRVGGRVYTTLYGDNTIDLGAEWVYGENGNIAYNMAYPHQLLASSKGLNDFDQYLFGRSDGSLFPEKLSSGILKAYYNFSERFEEMVKYKGSYGDYMFEKLTKWCQDNNVSQKEKDRLIQWIHLLDTSKRCIPSWYDIFWQDARSYWKCQGDNFLNWKERGFIRVLDCLANRIPKSKYSLDIMGLIRFGIELIEINYTNPKDIVVKVKIDKEEPYEYKADHVIFTPSLGVLKEKYKGMFKPRLPEKNANAIEVLGFGTIQKIFMEFPTRWWSDDVSVLCCPWAAEEKIPFILETSSKYTWIFDVFAFYTIDHQPKVLCAWAVRHSAIEIEDLSDEELIEGLHLLLETFFGKLFDIPEPINVKRTTWYKDPLYRGSLSFPTKLAAKKGITPRDLANPVMCDDKPIILFAGEATHEIFFGTAHGAIESGMREAERINCYYWNPELQLSKLSIKTAMETEPMYTPDLVIIGAGIAGLTAAKTLEDANFKNYLLIEAQPHIGGRINSQLLDGKWIELGAQYLHGDGSELAQFCKDNNIIFENKDKDGDGMLITYRGQTIDNDLAEEVKNFIYDMLEKDEEVNEYTEEPFANLGSMLRSRFDDYLMKSNDNPETKKLKEGIFDWINRFLIIDNSCITLDDLSVKKYGDFKRAGGPENLTIMSGYESVLKAISKDIPSKNVLLNTAVQLIHWKQITKDEYEKPITLVLDNSRIVTAKCVIITCSLGYLKDHIKTMFVPRLPRPHFLSIISMGFGTINKIYLNYGEPWWKPDDKGFQFVWEKNKVHIFGKGAIPLWAKDLTGFDVVRSHRGVLLGWIGGKSAPLIENISEEEIGIGCTNLLRHFLKNYDIPDVKGCIRTTWSSNKYIRGSYSSITPICDETNGTPSVLARPIGGKITGKGFKVRPIMLFAGEATHERYYSTTHGAYETGKRQAELFLKYHVTEA